MNVERLPFDQYQRYRLVSDLLGTLRGKHKLEVLDVGGRTALLRGFLPKDHVTLVDLESSGERDLVLGDGAKLPFRDKSFDVVAAFDTLEHVPPKLRPAFVAECARVSRGYVVLAGPYHSQRVAEAEKILQSFLKQKLHVEHRYLEEHRHNGLPSREKTEEQLRNLGAEVESFGHANLERWLAMMCLSMYLDQDPALRGLAARVHEFYNRALYASDHAEPVYRHVVVASLAGGPLPKVDRILDPPRAPAGALEPFTELSGELVAFDRERDSWKLDRERLDEVNKDLARDLEGHSATLAEVEHEFEQEREETARLKELLQSERAQAQSAIEALEADLREHARTLEELERESALVREEMTSLESLLESERTAAKTSIDTLETDLSGHKARIEALALEARERLVSFDRERAEVREVIDELQRDLDGHKDSLAHVEHELALREAHIEELTRRLEDERGQALHAIESLEHEIATHRTVQGKLSLEAEALHAEMARVMDLLADERGQAERSIASLRSDIEAHMQLGADLARELAREQVASREVARTLRADLEEHQRVLATLRDEIFALRAELESLQTARAAEQAAARQTRDLLESEIVAHRGVQGELSAELERHRAALADVHAQLERTQGAAQAIQKELLAANASGEGLNRTLAAREAEIAELHALLRSRVQNLKRALSFKKPPF